MGRGEARITNHTKRREVINGSGPPKRLWALGKPNLPCTKAGARLHDRRHTRGHAALRGEGLS